MMVPEVSLVVFKIELEIFGEVLALVPRILVESLSACYARVPRDWAVRPK